jgi:hypothetical protein
MYVIYCIPFVKRQYLEYVNKEDMEYSVAYELGEATTYKKLEDACVHAAVMNKQTVHSWIIEEVL